LFPWNKKKTMKKKRKKWSAACHRDDVAGLAGTWSRLELDGLPREDSPPGARWSRSLVTGVALRSALSSLLAVAASVPRGGRSARSSAAPWPETTPYPIPWAALHRPASPLLWIYSKKTEGRKEKVNRRKKNRRGKEAGEQEGGTESGVSGGRRCTIVIGVMRGPPKWPRRALWAAKVVLGDGPGWRVGADGPGRP